jgi:hypothetical protein
MKALRFAMVAVLCIPLPGPTIKPTAWKALRFAMVEVLSLTVVAPER